MKRLIQASCLYVYLCIEDTTGEKTGSSFEEKWDEDGACNSFQKIGYCLTWVPSSTTIRKVEDLF